MIKLVITFPCQVLLANWKKFEKLQIAERQALEKSQGEEMNKKMKVHNKKKVELMARLHVKTQSESK